MFFRVQDRKGSVYVPIDPLLTAAVQKFRESPDFLPTFNATPTLEAQVDLLDPTLDDHGRGTLGEFVAYAQEVTPGAIGKFGNTNSGRTLMQSRFDYFRVGERGIHIELKRERPVIFSYDAETGTHSPTQSTDGAHLVLQLTPKLATQGNVYLHEHWMWGGFVNHTSRELRTGSIGLAYGCWEQGVFDSRRSESGHEFQTTSAQLTLSDAQRPSFVRNNKRERESLRQLKAALAERAESAA